MDNGSIFFVIILLLSPLILVLAVGAFAIISGAVFLIGSGISLAVSRIVSGQRDVDASDLVDDAHPDKIMNGWMSPESRKAPKTGESLRG